MTMLATASESQPAVVVQGVTLNYFTPERETLALSNVSLTVEQGEFVAIVGSSGCGKSTLLSLVSGLIRPSRGAISIAGRPVTAPSPQVGYMFQKDTLLDWRTILDNVLIGAELLRARQARRARARQGPADALRAGRIHARACRINSRAACASAWRWRARCAASRICCCSTSRSPPSTIRRGSRSSDEIAAILRSENKTSILVTHDIGEAISMADRVIVMSRRPGRIKSEHRIASRASATRGRRRSRRASAAEFGGYFQTIWDELDVHDIQ